MRQFALVDFMPFFKPSHYGLSAIVCWFVPYDHKLKGSWAFFFVLYPNRTQTSFFSPFHSDSMNRCILSALSLIMVSVTCPHLSIVKAVIEWPRLLETVFTSTPFCSANVAYPCPDGIIATKRKSLVPQGFEPFVAADSIPFPALKSSKTPSRKGGLFHLRQNIFWKLKLKIQKD